MAPTVVRVTSFNVNQNSSPAHQRADLRIRVKDSDVVLCQETVDLDLGAFVRTMPGWAYFQQRNGDNDGHANTAVLYRTSLGVPAQTAVEFLGDAQDTRARYLVGVLIAGVWYWSAHIFPKRDTRLVAGQVSRVGTWVKEHPGLHVGGFDRNQCPPGVLENATGLKWHGIGIDGFLTNLSIANIAEFPKGFSDHPGVRGDVSLPGQNGGGEVTTPTQTPLQRILAQLRVALAKFKREGKAAKAKRAQGAIDVLDPPAVAPKPKAAPKPYEKTTVRDGKTIDQLTNYALYAVEKRLGFTPGSLTVVQGSYNGGAGAVSASAGTHDGGGVVDLTAANWQDKVRALRSVGFAAWHRPPNWDGRGGGEHIHAVLIGNDKLSPSAARQVTQYRNHTNGLANFGADNTWHPDPIPTFKMPKFAQEEA